MRMGSLLCAGLALVAGSVAGAADAPPSAALFGAREAVQDMALSPDGNRIAFIAPSAAGQGNALWTVDLAGNRMPVRAVLASGKPERLTDCGWVSDKRLLCTVFAVGQFETENAGYTRLIAVDADGANLKLVSRRTSSRTIGTAFGGGSVVDWLPGADGSVLLTRVFLPESSIGTNIADRRQGLGVERVDTLTLRTSGVEQPKPNAVEYISDGAGKVRIFGYAPSNATGYDGGRILYSYRTSNDRGWKALGTYEILGEDGFNPYAADAACDCVYGFRKRDGRKALVRIALDGSAREDVLLDRPDVDVDGLVRVGRARRVVGASFATERREVVYFDDKLKALAASLSKALPGLPLIRFVDASLDESKLLLWAGSDADPGRYFIFDKAAKKLDEIMLSRPELEGVKLAQVRAVTYPAADGTMIPGYLTLPPGGTGKGLPAIVMPHGGPGSRDEWGFDWLSQYYANRGYAVLQPNFRGSTGYGDAWFQKNGFQSWRTAVGDVVDAGRWLVSSGVADPGKLAIMGWSYGGYAALQSGVLAPSLFKAIVAVAPVTDLAALKEERRTWSDFTLVNRFVGTGPHIREGSPAQNARAIAAPVLLFHGTQDLNVAVNESRLMDDRLRDAGKRSELVIYDGLDHSLDDSVVRRQLLERSDAFMRAAWGG